MPEDDATGEFTTEKPVTEAAVSEEAVSEEAEPEQELPLPPATFEFFVLSLKAQAEMAMGLFRFGNEQDAPPSDLRVARHSIDLLAMLQDKTKGNLNYGEQRMLENSVTELRFRFVQVADSAQKK